MPEPTAPSAGTGDSPQPAAPAAPATDPKPAPVAPAPSTDQPAVTLTKEQWEAAYKSDRFKQLNERAQKAGELEKQIEAEKEAKLKEQGKWEDVAKSKDEQLTQMQTAVVNAEIKAVAATLGAVNPAIVANAIDRSGVKFNKDGTAEGVTEAVEALKASDPYLFNNSNNNQTPPRVGSPTNPGTNNTGYKFTKTQIRDPKFYRENRSAIMDALKHNQIDPNN